MPATPARQRSPLITIVRREHGKPGPRFNFHAGQQQAWKSTKRVVLVLAGVRSGKTSFGPLWLYREMRRQGPGDYLVAAPTFPLINKAAGPELERVFTGLFRLGAMSHSPWEYRISATGHQRTWPSQQWSPTRVIFGHANSSESLAAMTAKAAWLDEAGQKEFKQESWEEIQQRVSIDLGRILITTTVYRLGWLKQKIYDPWKAADGNHPLYDVIQFSSTMNPAFPVEEYERGRRELPAWKFHQKFDGQFAKPIGLIYDCFDDTVHKVPRFPIPAHWRRHVGLDFGGVNTAAVFFAEDPETRNLYAYREYKAGGRAAAEHAAEIKRGEPAFATVVGGSKSEGQWRQEFTAGGLPVREPDQPEVEVGIDRVYGAIKSGKLFVFNTQMDGLLEELGTYSRELDEAGEPTEKIEDKETFHRLDGARYVLSYLFRQPTSLFHDADRAASISSKIPLFAPQTRGSTAVGSRSLVG
jgi:hypothetical protein